MHVNAEKCGNEAPKAKLDIFYAPKGTLGGI